jgi:hypothetical protein
LIHSLRDGPNRSFGSSSTETKAFRILKSVASTVQGWAALMQAGTCASLLDVLKSTEDDLESRYRVVNLMASRYCEKEDACDALIQAGMCPALVATLASMTNKSATVSKDEESRIKRKLVAFVAADTSNCINLLYRVAEGRLALIQAGLFDVLAAAFMSIQDESPKCHAKGNFAALVHTICRYPVDCNNDFTSLTQSGVCDQLVAALVSLNTSRYDDAQHQSRLNTVNSIRALCEHSVPRFSMVQSGVCSALTVALSSTQFDLIKDRIVDCMTRIATEEQSRMNLIQAGARAALSAAHNVKDTALEPAYVETEPDRYYRHYRYKLRKLICLLAPQSHDEVAVEHASTASIIPKAAVKPNTAVKAKTISKLAVCKTPKLKVAKANTVSKQNAAAISKTISKPKNTGNNKTAINPEKTAAEKVARTQAAVSRNVAARKGRKSNHKVPLQDNVRQLRQNMTN